MATIVQPYNPWREQLALTALGNVAGNIIGDIWKTHRQNEQNRKANAFRGQLQQDLQNNAQPEISLIPKEAPQGYNSNPWANAFHQNNSPLTAFDIGTSTVGKTPSIQDIMRTADNLAATPRFSMLGQDVVQGAKNSLIQNTIANMFSNAGDIQGQMNALTMGAATGSVVPQVLMAFSPYAQKMAFPYSFGETDLGQSKVITARNEHTGEITPGMVMPVSVSPDTAANNATRNRELEDEERQREYERQNPPQTPIQDREGNYYGYNARNNEATPITDAEGYFIAGDTGKNPALTAAIKAIDTEMKSLDDRAKSIRNRYIAADDSELDAMNKELAPILARQQELQEERKAYVEQLFPKENKRKKPAQPATKESTPGTFMASADVQPVQTTQSADQTPITTMGASSADVRPTAQASDTLRPLWHDNIVQFPTPRNVSDDVRPVTPQAPAPAQPPAKKKNTVSFPTSAVYDPSRDTNVSADMVKSLSDLYSDYINYKNQLNLPPTFQEFLNNCIKDGVKIRHETRK